MEFWRSREEISFWSGILWSSVLPDCQWYGTQTFSPSSRRALATFLWAVWWRRPWEEKVLMFSISQLQKWEKLGDNKQHPPQKQEQWQLIPSTTPKAIHQVNYHHVTGIEFDLGTFGLSRNQHKVRYVDFRILLHDGSCVEAGTSLHDADKNSLALAELTTAEQ